MTIQPDNVPKHIGQEQFEGVNIQYNFDEGNAVFNGKPFKLTVYTKAGQKVDWGSLDPAFQKSHLQAQAHLFVQSMSSEQKANLQFIEGAKANLANRKITPYDITLSRSDEGNIPSRLKDRPGQDSDFTYLFSRLVNEIEELVGDPQPGRGKFPILQPPGVEYVSTSEGRPPPRSAARGPIERIPRQEENAAAAARPAPAKAEVSASKKPQAAERPGVVYTPHSSDYIVKQFDKKSAPINDSLKELQGMKDNIGKAKTMEDVSSAVKGNGGANDAMNGVVYEACADSKIPKQNGTFEGRMHDAIDIAMDGVKYVSRNDGFGVNKDVSIEEKHYYQSMNKANINDRVTGRGAGKEAVRKMIFDTLSKERDIEGEKSVFGRMTESQANDAILEMRDEQVHNLKMYLYRPSPDEADKFMKSLDNERQHIGKKVIPEAKGAITEELDEQMEGAHQALRKTAEDALASGPRGYLGSEQDTTAAVDVLTSGKGTEEKSSAMEPVVQKYQTREKGMNRICDIYERQANEFGEEPGEIVEVTTLRGQAPTIVVEVDGEKSEIDVQLILENMKMNSDEIDTLYREIDDDPNARPVEEKTV